MSGVNKAILIGHVGKDPDIRAGANGTVAKFSMATSKSWRDKKTGERREQTDWHRVVVFNDGLAKVVEQYVKKGSKVYVEGEIRTRKWADQAGIDRYITEIVLGAFRAQVVLLDRADRPAPSEESYSSAPAGAAAEKPPFDDEIPF